MIKVVIQNLVSREGQIKSRVCSTKQSSRRSFVIGNVGGLTNTSARIKKIMGFDYDEILVIDSEEIPIRQFKNISVDFYEHCEDAEYEKCLKAGLE